MPSIASCRLSAIALRVGVGVALAGLSQATAQAAPSAQEVQSAREVFGQAEQDEDAGRWQDALDKLRRVAEVKLTAGVRYHLALCEEHTGYLATALAGYAAAEDQAVAENAQDVLRLVGPERATLAPRVPRLAIHVSPEVARTTVTLDGVVVAPEQLSATLPVNPGSHRVEATAPGHATTSVGVTLRERDVTFLEVVLPPPPGATGVPATRAPGRTEPDPFVSRAPEPSHGRAAPLVATALALALAGGGVGAYMAAESAHADAVHDCSTVMGMGSTANACDSLKTPVRAWDWAAAGAWTGAAVAATVAVILWARRPRDGPPAALAHLVVGPTSIGAIGNF